MEPRLQRRLDTVLFIVLAGLFAWALYEHYSGDSETRLLLVTGAMVLSSATIFVRQRSAGRFSLFIGSAVTLIASFVLS
jgi:hypothetical protein